MIASENELKKMLRATTREDVVGVHDVEYEGKTLKAVGRFKQNILPSSWQLLDRDIDEHTPSEFAALTTEKWLGALLDVIPGLDGAAKVIMPSASARIRKNGKKSNNCNVHVWVQVQDPADVERMCATLLLRSIVLGKAWTKPKMSRTDPGTVVGTMPVTLLDHSVWTPGRLAFEGQPSVELPYSVEPPNVAIVPGGRLDTHKASTPLQEQVQRLGRTIGTSLALRHSASGLVLDCTNLTLDTPLELQSGETLTVRDALPRLENDGKLRCQAPFRESSSFAAFLSKSQSGKPFVHDSGSGTNHWLNDQESVDLGYGAWQPPAPCVEAVLKACMAMEPKELESQFAELAAGLSSTDAHKVLRLVKARTGVTLETLRTRLKEVTAQQTAAAIERQVGARTSIPYMPADVTKMAEMVEGTIVAVTPVEEYFTFGGCLAQVTQKDSQTAAVCSHASRRSPVIELHDEVSARRLIERNVVFQGGAGNAKSLMEVPNKVIETLLKKREHAAPAVSGLLRHPIVFPDGTIWAGPGFHADSGLLYVGDEFQDLRAYNQRDAKRALKRLKSTFLEGFEFASDLDADMALASLFTGVVRRLLPQAPGFAYVAPMQASGKTTLARMVNLMLTGQELTPGRFPQGNEEETAKYLLSLLQESPVMVCLDNLTDGITFSSATLAQAMTSAVFHGRVLGKTQTMSCPTNALFIVTGNNVRLGADEATRWLIVCMDTKSSRPHERTFKHPDVIANGLTIRAAVLRDVIGIISGFLTHSKPDSPVTRFSLWDQMVRQSLVWAGATDAADAIRVNVDTSSTNNAAVALVTALAEYFQGKSFAAFELAQKFGVGPLLMTDVLQRIGGALSELKARTLTNPNSVGRALGSITGRPIEHDGRIWTLRRKTIKGTEHYSVEIV